MSHSKKLIPITITKADTFYLRFKGLMFRKNPIVGQGLWIIPCNSIHMWFMRFSIDVIFLDAKNRVIKKIEDVKPWSFVIPVSGARSVLELPIGTIQKCKIETGQVLILKCSNAKKEVM
ncbi:DUF192 domain-containing protein [Aquibacillus halophilus]|uniref:DUF192 domain-containing protein n=1 Tax=Aquibacillus halophilus TaxID=930132 RepID=A0A6A8DSX6_9BACI|nr:DUF192 domain-containing protein [Aquibacillus halophilus]MRH44312.1 DUF192 domain-containing protein [Aquibacillus halophilus]